MRVSAVAFGAIVALFPQAFAFTPVASLNRMGTVVHSTTIRSEWRMDDPEPEVSTGVHILPSWLRFLIVRVKSACDRWLCLNVG